MATAKNIEGRKALAARSRILWEITALLVVVMVISGLAIFLSVRASQDRLIEKSVDKLLDESAEDVSSFFFYTMQQRMAEFMVYVRQEGTARIAAALLQEQLSESQRKISDYLGELANTNPMGVNLHMIIVISSSDFRVPEPLIFACNREDLIYHWKIPPDIAESLLAGKPYVYREEGIPELGLQGEYLAITRKIEDPQLGYVAGYLGFKPFADEVSAVKGYYDQERRHLLLTLGTVVGLSVLAVIFVSFFVLSWLIRKRITMPLERLAKWAERVMEGDLDVEIQVQEGGDFSILERAFREMLESIRRTFAAAMKGE